MSFQRVFRRESGGTEATAKVAGRAAFEPRRAYLLVRNVCAGCATARAFALLMWLTFAVATFPSSTASPDADAFPTVPEAPLQAEDAACASHAARGRVQSPSASRMLTASPGDMATVSACWAGDRMHVQEAWQIAGEPRTVLVAVLDTGVESDEAGLRERVVGTVGLTGGDDTGDSYGHGTLVAATIAAIAPNCTLLNIKVADDRGFCTTAGVAEGIRTATRWGTSVINLSLEVEPSPELEAAVESAWENGVVLVAAGGTPRAPCAALVSASDMSICYPAGYPEVIAVACTNPDDAVWPLSGHTWWTDVAAPGYKTSVVMSDGLELHLTGTSSAAAHVSGVAALLYGIAADTNGNGRINDEVRRALECTAQPIDAEGSGSGIVDARAAVAFLSP